MWSSHVSVTACPLGVLTEHRCVNYGNIPSWVETRLEFELTDTESNGSNDAFKTNFDIPTHYTFARSSNTKWQLLDSETWRVEFSKNKEKERDTNIQICRKMEFYNFDTGDLFL